MRKQRLYFWRIGPGEVLLAQAQASTGTMAESAHPPHTHTLIPKHTVRASEVFAE